METQDDPLPPRLRKALEAAPADDFGQRWAGAEGYRRTFVAVLRADGTLIVESKRVEDGYRRSCRWHSVPANLRWRALGVVAT